MTLPAILDHRPDAQSFYHLRGLSLDDVSCAGLACFASRADAPVRWQAAHAGPRVHCLGKCYAGPSHTGDDPRPAVVSRSRETVLLRNVVAGGARTLASYRALGGGLALERARALDAAQLIEIVRDSGLRGRGGAGFPAGDKWRYVATEASPRKYVVANGDEGDAGSFSDRFLMEEDPFRLIEAMAIAARAVGAQRGFIYLRKEYPAAARSLLDALDEARRAGWLGAAFDIALVPGEGSYVCGEETALLNSIERRRPQARLRPPQITHAGLFGQPTLMNNVETLCAIPWIVERGAEAYARLGFSRSRGTKLLSLNSLFRHPGLYEVEFGITLREVVHELGGGLRRGALKALMVGGPLAGLLGSSQLDTCLGYEEMQAAGASVGHGGVIAFADDTSLADIVGEVFRFGAEESCGGCVPCHRGTPRIAAMFSGRSVPDRNVFSAVVDALAATSLCGHGRGLAEFARSLEANFAPELQELLA